MTKYSIILMSINKTKIMKKLWHRSTEKEMFTALEGMNYIAVPKKKSLALDNIRRAGYAGLTIALLTFLTLGSSFVPNKASADSISDQINALQAENEANANAVANLQSQATSYQDAIDRLQAQILNLQGQIDNNVAKQAELQTKIAANQEELNKQKKVLGENIKVMYVDGQPTTIEMLASSKNLSEFVDKEEYRTSVRNKIQTTLKKIADLQNQLNSQKEQVESLLKEQQNQQKSLSNARAEQANMLAYNESQQAGFNAKTQANQQKIDELVAQQLRANSVLPASGYYFIRFPGSVRYHSPSVNDYPYANSGFGMSTAPGCVDNDGPDEWGYCTRQCVSYAAWAVERSGRSAPRYYGNAKDWITAAQRDGILVTTSPQPGDVAISTAGTWGHAMYVEQVSGDQIYVSQYNQQLNGQYSTQWRTYR